MGDNGIRTHMKKSMSFSEFQPCCTQGYFSDIFNCIQNILISFYTSKYRSNHVYQSLFINKAHVNRGSRNGMTCIYVAKTKALISFAVTAKLICVFVFAYAKSRFSYGAAHLVLIEQYLPVLPLGKNTSNEYSKLKLLWRNKRLFVALCICEQQRHKSA